VEIIRGEVEAAATLACLPARWEGGELLALALAEAHALPGVSRVGVSNNLAENSMRPVALGRKNWIHVGSRQAGPKVAAILSIVESCRRLKVPIREYLAGVLPGLADTSIQRLQNLHPRLGRRRGDSAIRRPVKHVVL